MNQPLSNFTEPVIVTDENELSHRSYISFYFKGERIREYHGKNINKSLNPNRAKSLDEKRVLLKQLCFEIHKALSDNRYPAEFQPETPIAPVSLTNANDVETGKRAIRLLFEATVSKIRADLSRTYKRDLKRIYRQLKRFLTQQEMDGPISGITSSRIEAFLSRFGSSGTYYMNKRRTLGVLFSVAGNQIEQPLKAVRKTARRKAKAHLHEKYLQEQLKPIFVFLRHHYPNLYLCCLMTYSTWLRPHEEIRLLTVGDFKADYSEIHLSGDENKGGKVRVVYVPPYVRNELVPKIHGLDRSTNIFTLNERPFNYSYFNTMWSRACSKMVQLGLVHENQTIYSFRHTAAVQFYRKTKDVHLLQKLLGHSNIIVTLTYLRSLGEIDIEVFKQAAPEFELLE